jgi:2-haloacid dehalogenase
MIRLAVFDAYGTLFDVAGAARAAAAEPGGEVLSAVWPGLAEDWRRKQLEYSWLRAVMRDHADFAQVTAGALDWAMEARGLSDPALRARLLALYDRLPAYPEAAGALRRLRARGLSTAILSNGTPAMLASAVAAAGLDGLFDAVLSVEAVRVYKPDARVYGLVAARFGTDPAEVLFVSSNGWDAAAAAAFGFRTVWVNRAGLPADRLPGRPAVRLGDLSALETAL